MIFCALEPLLAQHIPSELMAKNRKRIRRLCVYECAEFFQLMLRHRIFSSYTHRQGQNREIRSSIKNTYPECCLGHQQLCAQTEGEKRISMATGSGWEEKKRQRKNFDFSIISVCCFFVLWSEKRYEWVQFFLSLESRWMQKIASRQQSSTRVACEKKCRINFHIRRDVALFRLSSRAPLFFALHLMILFNLLFFHFVIVLDSLLMSCSFVDTGIWIGRVDGGWWWPLLSTGKIQTRFNFSRNFNLLLALHHCYAMCALACRFEVLHF